MSEQIVASRTGLLIVIPTLGRPVNLEWAWAFKSLTPPINYNTNFLQIFGKPVDVARNEAAEEAVKQNATYLFFIGDDVVIPSHALKQLIFRMEQDPEIAVVGGIYCSKSDPPAPLVFRGNGSGSYWDWKVGEFFEVTGLGMDCTLIRASVFEKLSKPYFLTIDSDQFLDGVNKADQWTEDLYFCKKVIEEAKMKVYADASVLCAHLDVLGNKRYTLPANSLPTRRLATEAKLKAIDIGSGPLDRAEQFPEYQLIRVDLREKCQAEYRADACNLPFANEEFDLVFSSHVLEHFSRTQALDVLKEWVRILKPDGKLRLVLPNIAWAAEQILTSKIPSNDALNVLYGMQSYSLDYHKNGFTPQSLEVLVKSLGFTKVNIELMGYNIILEAQRE